MWLVGCDLVGCSIHCTEHPFPPFTAACLQTSKEGLTVEQRLIPKEPSYLIMNLAMSNNAWAKVDEDLTYPGVAD
jgi:hypothetical protein